jgi:multiple sugar transport system substrate-binding protein
MLKALAFAGAGTIGASALVSCAATPTAAPAATQPAVVEKATEAPTATPVPATPEAEPTPTPGRAAAAGRAITLDLYEVWGGHLFDGWVRIAEMYEQLNPDVGVKVTYAPGHQDNPKILTAIAGGVPPDMAMIVDFATAQWAELGAMTDLTPYFEAAGLTGEQFWEAAWYLMNYKGKVWQMPFDVDPNFP